VLHRLPESKIDSERQRRDQLGQPHPIGAVIHAIMLSAVDHEQVPRRVAAGVTGVALRMAGFAMPYQLGRARARYKVPTITTARATP
jgi:hypothetical protein